MLVIARQKSRALCGCPEKFSSHHQLGPFLLLYKGLSLKHTLYLHQNSTDGEWYISSGNAFDELRFHCRTSINKLLIGIENFKLGKGDD